MPSAVFRLDETPLTKAGTGQLPQNEKASYPLSFAQQRMWFLACYEPEIPYYNEASALRLHGRLNTDALQKALAALIERHHILRTTYHVQDGRPVQMVAEAMQWSFELPIIDLRGRGENTRKREAKNLLSEIIRRPFNLERDLMLRATLLWLGDEDHILLLVSHHIASDGWSRGIQFRELTVLYKAIADDRPPQLENLPLQYAEYTLWQRQRLQGERLTQHLAYWRQQLDKLPVLLDLPADRPRPSLQSHHGDQYVWRLPVSLNRALTAFSRQHNVTLFMTLLAVFKVLLYRYSGQTDIVVGTPIAGRTRQETETLIGFFVNTLVLRDDLSGEPAFSTLLKQIRATALSAYTHLELPFEKLVEELQPARSLSHAPMFQVMFGLQNVPRSALALSGLSIQTVAVHNGCAKTDLTVLCYEEDDTLRIRIEYNTDLFDADRIKRLATHYQTLLQSAVAAPECSIATLPILSDCERQKILYEWNPGASAYPQDQSVHQLFEAQAKQTPDATAVVFEERSLSYHELNQRANQLAHYLKSLGVAAETLVGICVTRSPEMIVGMLGILKAGGAYLPLDPDDPQARIAYLLEDAQVTLLMTQQRFLRHLPTTSVQRVCLDCDWPVIATYSRDNPAMHINPDHLAYVMYTSGSTGQPKGVCIPYRAITRLVKHTNYIELTASDRIAQAANVSFDAATFEIWGALLNGAQLIGMDRTVALSPDRFADWLREHRISVLFLTTALFNQITSAVPHAFQSLRYLLFGGEKVNPHAVRQIMDHAPPEHLLHVYGPTENTTFSTWYRVSELSVQASTVPIGRPISNSEVYLLDDYQQPVPIGVPGNLYVGGAGLARGYLKRPALTAEKFIPHPFGKNQLYKTGDLACYLPDGNIEFLGRRDNQVKLRGFRIELGEIEAVLSQHPSLQTAVVTVQNHSENEKRLLAYFVPNKLPAPDHETLRQFLKVVLPDYMLPATFIALDTLPLTPSGKIDYHALPQPDGLRQHSQDGFVGPRNGLESQLARIWEQVLGIKSISVTDNFFTLGGHSLLAVSLFSRIEKHLGRKLPLATLFQNPTIAKLAAILRDQGWTSDWSSLVAIQPHGISPPFFCVPGVGGNVLEFDMLAKHLGPEQPFYGLQAQGLDGKTPPHTCVEEMASHYIREIQSLQAEGSYFLGGYSFGGKVALEIARRLHKQGHQVALLALIDTSFQHTSKPLRAERADYFKHLARPLTSGGWQSLEILLKNFIRPFYIPCKRIAYKTYLRLECPLPHTLSTLHVFEAGMKASHNYAPAPYPGKITFFSASEDPAAQIAPWQQLAGGGVELHRHTGGHWFIRQEPGAQQLAQSLKACLEKAHGKITKETKVPDN